MSDVKHTPGPWSWIGASVEGKAGDLVFEVGDDNQPYGLHSSTLIEHWDPPIAAANRALIAAAPELLAALKEGRRAIGDHFAPTDCYATGPLTGDPMRDLVECPACSFIVKYDAAIAKAEGK